jgi:Domain of unknown function (DUF4372)
LHALDGYLTGQSDWLVNYAERHRAGLRVGTAITEGTANFLVNRRMSADAMVATWQESLRDIEACLSAQSAKLYHMGFREPCAARRWRTPMLDAIDASTPNLPSS